jgi:predicted permease
METQIKILQILIPIFLGIAFRYSGIFDDREGKILRHVVVRLCVPILVFFAMYEAGSNAINSIPVTIAAFLIVTIALFCVGFVISAMVKSGPRKSAVHAAITFGNYAWMGYGVCHVLLGEEGLRRAVFFSLLWWPAFYALGLPIGMIHNRKENTGIPVKKALLVAAPILIAMATGLILNVLNVEIPPLLQDTLKPFGDMTVPLILFSVGLTLNFESMLHSLKPALIVSLVTLILAPVIGLLAARLLATDGVTYKAIILESAMPVATLTPVLAEHYDIDLDIVNTSIVLSTTLSMLTLPVVATLLG